MEQLEFHDEFYGFIQEKKLDCFVEKDIDDLLENKVWNTKETESWTPRKEMELAQSVKKCYHSQFFFRNRISPSGKN